MLFTEIYEDKYKNNKPIYNVIDPNYFNTLYKNISYEFNNLFSSNDVNTIGITLHDLSSISRNYIEIFSSPQDEKTLKDKPDAGGNYNLWYKVNNNKTHALSTAFAKLLCCVGKIVGDNKELELKIPIVTEKGIELQSKKFYMKKDLCKNIRGEDFDDDNLTAPNAKDACLDFMVKYCMFLKKYDSKNVDYLKKFCPCILNDSSIHGKDPDSVLRTLEIAGTSNVRCAVRECDNPDSYKPRNMRTTKGQACPDIVDCSINVGDVNMANSDAKLNIDQKCSSSGQQAAEETKIGGEEQEKVKEDAKEIIEKEVEEIKKEVKKDLESEKDSEEEPEKEQETVGFFDGLINFFKTLFGLNKENFTVSNFSFFDFFYFIFSLFIVYFFIFNDPYKLQKYIYLKN